MRSLVVILSLVGCLASAAAADVPNLWQRKEEGSDWPGFLGPAGNGTSDETGFFTAEGLRGAKVLWQHPLGTGYAMPSISRGRLFQFSRHRDRNRLECLRAETAAPVWQFE